jgi:hypothetical protein
MRHAPVEVKFYKEDETFLVREWLKPLPSKVQKKCLTFIAQLERQGHELRRPLADFLRDGIYELRPSYQGVSYRILYFFSGKDLGRPISRNHEGRRNFQH